MLIVISLIIIGILFILAEIFLFPGISVAGILGFACVVGSVIYSFITLGNSEGFITLIATIVIFAALMLYIVKSNFMQKIGLKTEIKSTIDSNIEKYKPEVGDRGITESRLAPIGKVTIKDKVFCAKSDDGCLINEDKNVVVTALDKAMIYVHPIDE